MVPKLCRSHPQGIKNRARTALLVIKFETKKNAPKGAPQMTVKQKNGVSRRRFLKTSLGAAVAAGFPTILPSSVFGQMAPSNRINVGAIGVGRISRVHDLPAIWPCDDARIVAVCDLDSYRVDAAKTFINDVYAKKTGKAYDGVTGYHSYHDLLANKDIDAVVI